MGTAILATESATKVLAENLKQQEQKDSKIIAQMNKTAEALPSLEININNDFIYIGCQILSRNLFENYKKHNFSISEIWYQLEKKDKLNGFESSKKFYHLTNLETFKKLKDF